MRLLIIEDEAAIANSLAAFLKNKGYVVDIATNYEQALDLESLGHYSLIISDYLLPGKNGYEIMKEIRKNNQSIPIIMLSAVPDTLNKIRFLNSGADDYLTKPFSGQELIARIKALLRRKSQTPKENISFADLDVDIEKEEVRRGQKKIYLTTKELAILKYLMQNPRSTCPRPLIIENAWDESAHHLSNTIESHILKLRKKIDFKKPQLIHTIKGEGYKIDLQA